MMYNTKNGTHRHMGEYIRGNNGRHHHIYGDELRAYDWLIDKKGLEAVEISFGDEPGDPDFIYYGTHGYEVKSLSHHSITFSRAQYKSQLQWGKDCDLIVMEPGNDIPVYVVPFSQLPPNGGDYNGKFSITLTRSDPYRSMIAVTRDEKDRLEKIRGLIETKLSVHARSWPDLIRQALCCVLQDRALLPAVIVDRMGIRFFKAKCPYCNTDHPFKDDIKLFWLITCEHCHEEFIVKYIPKHS
jgi:hypothetical protein